jgi:hypothetical protein
MDVLSTIFSQEWWLAAAGGDSLRIVSKQISPGTSVSLPVFRTRWFGMKATVRPPYTRLFGPHVHQEELGRPLSSEKFAVAVRDLVAELQEFHLVEYVLDCDSAYPGAFVPMAFQVEDMYTFTTEGVASAKKVWNNLRPNLRSTLRSAQRSYSVVRHSDIERFIRLAKLERRWRDKNCYDALRRIWAEVSSRGVGTVLSAYDASGAESAVCVLVWDDKCLYYLLSTRIRNAGARNANIFLIWSAIQKAEELGVVFDMDGYHSVEAFRFQRRFGLKLVERKLVYRSSVAWKAAELIKDTAKLVLTHGCEISNLGGRFTADDEAFPELRAPPNAPAMRVAE